MKNIYDSEVDIEGLRLTYRTKPNFKAFIDWLATTGDLVQLTALELKEELDNSDCDITYAEAVAVLKAFDGHAAGRFRVGRHGHDTRVEFSVDGTDALAREIIDDSKDEAVPSHTIEAEAPSLESTFIRHKLWLRRDLEVSIDLPADLSEHDVTRLSDFLRTLPFSESQLKSAA